MHCELSTPNTSVLDPVCPEDDLSLEWPTDHILLRELSWLTLLTAVKTDGSEDVRQLMGQASVLWNVHGPQNVCELEAWSLGVLEGNRITKIWQRDHVMKAQTCEKKCKFLLPKSKCSGRASLALEFLWVLTTRSCSPSCMCSHHDATQPGWSSPRLKEAT